MIVPVAALLSCLLAAASAAPQPIDSELRESLPDRIDGLKMPKRLSSAIIDPALRGAEGTQDVIIKLKSPPVAMMANDMSQAELMAHKAMIEDEQAEFMERTGTSSKEITCVQTLLNAVFLTIDAAEVGALVTDADVVSIHRVRNFEKYLSETVPYIGATKVQNEGYDGTGVRVAVLDDGIDYTHIAFGGPGTIEGYDAAYKDFTSRDGLFPTDKVIGGYDFVGEEWPFGPLLPDDDPIALGSHGTSVGNIINGVAPGVSLYAVKVCSAISSECSEIALIQGMEFALDPNGDGNLSDAVDVINMSLGTDYGQPFDDPLSQAVDAASALGVLVVAAAGNSGDKPYIAGTPANSMSALSVAQTQVPSASLQSLIVDSASYPAVFQPWSKSLGEVGVITGTVQYGDGNGGNLLGCEDFVPGSLAGKVVLVDRGECNFTLKISKISLGGGLAGIIGLVAPGAPFPGGDGGDVPIDVPGYMISQADADAIKAAGPDSIATLDLNDVKPLVMQMVGSSSRGPQNQGTNLIKPEIGAPGSSVAAIAGTGSGTAPFGGTSGATPMVAGSAALLLQAYPFLSPAEVKARLMNNGEINIETDPFQGLAPITRIGGGEVRVDKALTARAAAWDEDTLQGALSFGFVDLFEKTHTLFKRIRIRNYSDDVITYTITPTFRYADDEDSGAVAVSTIFPGKVQVGAKEDRIVSVSMEIRGDRLPDNNMNSGTEGANGTALTANEYDGYLVLDDGVQPMYMAWHVLPRKAANVTVETDTLDFTENPATVDISNTGVGKANLDAYSLLAVSPNLPEGGPGEENPTIDLRAVGVRTLEVEPGVCSDTGSFIWSFAITLWERYQHLASIAVEIDLDIDRDGFADYLMFTSDAGQGAVDGRQIVVVAEAFSFNSSSVFFVESSMNTANIVLNVCAEQLGLSQQDLFVTTVDIGVYTYSTFYSDLQDDFVDGITVTPGGERYVALTEDLGPNQKGTITVSDLGSFPDNSDELGVMLIANGDRGPGDRGGATQESEITLLRA